MLASGRTDIPVPPQGNDEVGTLASALERMRREINTSREAILAASAELEARIRKLLAGYAAPDTEFELAYPEDLGGGGEAGDLDRRV